MADDVETQTLARDALTASGLGSPDEFIALFGPDVIGRTTFYRWLRGSAPATPMAKMMLREFIRGWRPGMAYKAPKKPRGGAVTSEA